MKKPVYDRRYDIVVAGGGVSGAVAALAAARCGADVLVVEQCGYLGGTLTSCGVGPMMTFHAGEKQVILGIMQEIVDALKARGYSPGHVPDTKQYTDTVTPFNAEGLKVVLDDLLAKAGVTMLFHSFIGAAAREGDRISALTVCNKDGMNSLKARVFIDATGDGDVAAWAGAAMSKGRESDGASQPLTMKMKYCNVDTKALKAHVLANIKDFPKMIDHVDLFSRDIPMDLEGFNREVAQAKADGELDIARENVLLFGTDREGEFIFNTTRIIGHDATCAMSLSDAERMGRRQCVQLDRFIRKYIPGFKNALLEYTGPSIGVRSSRQLVGKYTLTAEDILACKRFDSVIAHSGYPIDIHNPTGEGTASTFLQPGSYYDIPYEVMLCGELSNLIVTGRCCSVTFEAQASLRLTPSVGAMGQAAGIAAAISAKEGGDVRTVNVSAVQSTLKSQGAFLRI